MLWLQAFPPSQPVGASQDILKGLAGGVLGLIASLATIFVGWLRDRDKAAQRIKEIDEATRIVSFWKLWLETSEKLHPCIEDSGRENAKKQLALASSRVLSVVQIEGDRRAQQITDIAAFSSMKRRLPLWRKISLLYKPSRRVAWIPRLVFYCIFLFSTLSSLLSIPLLVLPFMILVNFPLMVSAWVLSVRLERPKGSRPAISNNQH